jgi:hypothetical protein
MTIGGAAGWSLDIKDLFFGLFIGGIDSFFASLRGAVGVV